MYNPVFCCHSQAKCLSTLQRHFLFLLAALLKNKILVVQVRNKEKYLWNIGGVRFNRQMTIVTTDLLQNINTAGKCFPCSGQWVIQCKVEEWHKMEYQMLFCISDSSHLFFGIFFQFGSKVSMYPERQITRQLMVFYLIFALLLIGKLIHHFMYWKKKSTTNVSVVDPWLQWIRLRRIQTGALNLIVCISTVKTEIQKMRFD